MSRQQPTLPSAAGYPNYSFLTDPIISTSLLTRFREAGIASKITVSASAEIPKEFGKNGNELYLRRAPEAEVKDYTKNQGLSHSDLNTEIIRMVINRAKYWSLKINEIDFRQIPNIQGWINSWREDAAKKLDLSITREILWQVPWEVSPFNKGTCAGMRTGAYNLGTAGTPIQITEENIGERLAEVRNVLGEQGVSGSFMLVAPNAMRPMMYRKGSILYDAGQSGNAKSIVLLNGEVFPDLVGFVFIFTNEAPQYRDPTGVVTYTLLVGRKEAILMITQITWNRTIEGGPDDFSRYWQGLQVYGFKVIKPEELAIMYVTFK